MAASGDRLAGRGTRLAERINGAVVPDVTGPDDASERSDRWRRILGHEPEIDVLNARLALEGLDVDACRSLLGSVRMAAGYPLPEWFERFDAVLSRLSPEKPSRFQSTAVVPFQEVLTVFVDDATEQLIERAGPVIDNLGTDILPAFQQQLLASLSAITSLAIDLEFRVFVAAHHPMALFRKEPLASPPERKLYRRFVNQMRSGGLVNLFEQYAVLSRLIITAMDQWIESVAEFSERMTRDMPALAETFCEGRSPGLVTDISPGLSDPHNGGRRVIATTSSSGLKLVYKPRDMGIDRAVYQFIEWVNAEGRLLPLRVLSVVDRSTYGWVEFAAHSSCQDVAGIHRYYHRLGEVLCLLHLLRGCDCHLENIVAAGEQPMFLDLETMLHPISREFTTSDSADGRAAEILASSVLRTGLLPAWTGTHPGISIDVSGMGGPDYQMTGDWWPVWRDVNTDAMRLDYETGTMLSHPNQPMLQGARVDARDYAVDTAAGFAATYRFLVEHRDRLLSTNGPLSPFYGVKLRYVLRATRAYIILLQRLFHPEFLRDGADRSIEIERLARPLAQSLSMGAANPSGWKIYAAERDAIERLDIPSFSIFSDSDSLWAEGKPIVPHFLPETPFEAVRTQILRLSDEDLKQQVGFIRASIESRFAATRSTGRAAAAAGTDRHVDTEPCLTREDLIREAHAIAGRIRQAAIRGRDGTSTWFSFIPDPLTDRLSIGAMGESICEGKPGIAFFLSALGHVSANHEFDELATAALASLRGGLEKPDGPGDVWTSLGIDGIAGYIYGLVRMSAWLADRDLLDLAVQAAQRLTTKSIATDERLDVISGPAGSILGLNALWTATNSPVVIEHAMRCGDRLLNKRTRNTDHLSWQVPWASRPLTGFAHGAAGIAYALTVVSRMSGEKRFRDAAEEGIAYETAVYSQDAGNWPDFRELPGRPKGTFMTAWCHGAAGIGLARLGGLAELDSPAIRLDIDRALQCTLAAPIDDADHICCGNLGRADFLIEASRRLNRPDLLEEARRRVSAVVRRSRETGAYRLNAQGEGMEPNPSLFQGLSGIGYLLLRAAEPDRLPCLLLWQ